MAVRVSVRLWLAVCVLAAVVTLGAGGAVAQGEPAADDDDLVETSGLGSVALLVFGTVVLLASIELLIHALVRTAVRFGVSAFLLAVIFSGWEFDNVAFGLFTGFRELQNVAFGLAIGNAISIFGLTLALGALLYPFTIDVPTDYLLMAAAAPIALVPVLLSGTLTPALSVMFLLLYIVAFAYILQRERQHDRTFMQSDEVRDVTAEADGEGVDAGLLPARLRRLTWSDWFWPAMLVVSVGGIVVGAESSAAGVEGILETWNLTGTFLGVTLVTVLYTVDDILLILEPLRLGYEDVAVGGIIGSLVFFVTANVGIIGLVGAIQFRPETALFHLPALAVFTAMSVYFLRRGRMTRGHGAVLLGLYVLYLLLNLRLFAAIPIVE